MHLDRIALGDAGAAAFTITGAGVVLDDVQVAPGWDVAFRRPSPGFRRRVRPGDSAVVVLRRREGRVVTEHELEIGRLDDGSWELAVREQWVGDATRTVSTPAGDVTCRLQGGQLSLERAAVREGWSERVQEHDGEEVVVVFTRGTGVSTEDWEVVVISDTDGQGTPLVEREHRWCIAPVG